MKKLIALSCIALFACTATAQQTEGRIVYERTLQLMIRNDHPGPEGAGNTFHRPHTDKIEVLFGNNQSLRRQMEDETPDETQLDENEIGVTIMLDGMENLTYHNFTAQRLVERREFAARQYLVGDSIEKLNWKLTGASKNILSQHCQSATAQHIIPRMTIQMDNGKLKHEPVSDTMHITAWFAPAIPVPAGPQYQGQLPGLIMAADIDNGRIVYRAVELSPKVDLAAIKEPKNGRKVTQEQFRTERDKALKELQRNNRGANRKVLRIGG